MANCRKPACAPRIAAPAQTYRRPPTHRARDTGCRVFRTHWHLSQGPVLGPPPVPGVPTFSAYAAAGQKIH